MLKSNKYNNYSKKLLLDKNLIKSNNKSVISKFALYINMVVYNVTTLACIIALLKYNTNKLNKEILYSTKLQINKMCNIKNKIKGGTVLPSSYFGQDDSKLYSFEDSFSSFIVFSKSSKSLSSFFVRYSIAGFTSSVLN